MKNNLELFNVISKLKQKLENSQHMETSAQEKQKHLELNLR